MTAGPTFPTSDSPRERPSAGASAKPDPSLEDAEFESRWGGLPGQSNGEGSAPTDSDIDRASGRPGASAKPDYRWRDSTLAPADAPPEVPDQGLEGERATASAPVLDPALDPAPEAALDSAPDGVGVPPELEPTPRRSRFSWVPWNFLAHAATWIAAIALLAGAGYAAWWVIEPQLTKPYVYDEAAFSFAGHAVATTGLPLSNVGHMQAEIPGDFSKRFNWALWHPPAYVFTLGWAFREFGETEYTARMVGVLCNAVAALFAFLAGTIALSSRTRAAPLYAAAGAAMYVTNPFVIQSALLLDIDGTVLVASISLLLLLYTVLLRLRTSLKSPWTWLVVGMTASAFGLSLWCKMTTAFALPAAAAVYRILGTKPWRPWRLLIELPLIPGIGAGLFLGTWWLACQSTGMPFMLPFQILDHELRDAAGSTSSWRENPRVVLDLLSYVGLWVSPYLILLFVGSGLARVADLVVRPFVVGWQRIARKSVSGDPWGMWGPDFALMCGAGIGALYLIKLAASFPKYHITMMPFWAVGIAFLLFRYVKRVTWWELPLYGVVAAGMAGYFSSFVGDKFVLFGGYDFVFPLLVWPAALGFAFLLLCAVLGRHHLARQLTILGILLTLGWSWGVNSAQRMADYSTAYNYRTAGQKETAAYLSRILRPNQVYISSRDVAYYTTDQLYVDQDTWWEHLARLDAAGIKTFDGRIAGYDRVDVVCLFLWDPNLGAIVHSYLDELYEVSFQSLPFVVFVRTSP